MSLRMRTAIGVAALALLAVVFSATACGGGEEKAAPTPSPTPIPTPGAPPEVLFRDEIDGRILIILEYRASDETYFATVTGLTVERYREGKAAMEERLPSLVPDPCDVLWTLPVLLMDELEPADLRTSGCD